MALKLEISSFLPLSQGPDFALELSRGTLLTLKHRKALSLFTQDGVRQQFVQSQYSFLTRLRNGSLLLARVDKGLDLIDEYSLKRVQFSEELVHSRAVCQSEDGLLLTDYLNGSCLELKNGQLVQLLKDRCLSLPSGIIKCHSGIYVSNLYSHSLIKFQKKAIQAQYSQAFSRPFHLPRGLATVYSHLLLADQGNHRIIVAHDSSSALQFIREIDLKGLGLRYPVCISEEERGGLLVTCKGQRKGVAVLRGVKREYDED